MKTVMECDQTPRFKFFKRNGNYPRDLFLGCEMEVENNSEYGVRRKAEDIINDYRFLFAKWDGSLDNGCEINTHPFNLNWFIKNDAIDCVKDIRKKGFFAKRTCGFHIHLSKDFFTSLHIIKMIKLFFNYPNFIQRVSQRGGYGLRDYANPFIVKDGIVEDNVPNPCDDCDGRNCHNCRKPANIENLNLIESCRAVWKYRYDMDRFVALNMTNKNTLEIRIFQGTINPKLVMAYLEFAVACSVYTQKASFREVSERGLKRFVKKHKNKYINLYNSNILWGKCREEYDWKKVA